jgi:hypothetical protein
MPREKHKYNYMKKEQLDYLKHKYREPFKALCIYPDI